MKCCVSCFGPALVERVFFQKSPSDAASCPGCETPNAKVIDAIDLQDSFEALIDLYEDSADGVNLASALRRDWGLFRHPRMEDARAKELLVEILDDAEIVRRRFVPSPKCNSDSVVRWDAVRKELIAENRFFLKSGLDRDRLKARLGALIAKPGAFGAKMFRARVQSGADGIPMDKMGAPPAAIATPGRANPVGIPYLYLASDVDTAMAEVRPHTGQTIWILDFHLLVDELRIVDMCRPRGTISPFDAEAQDLPILHGDVEFLERWSEELARPVLPGSPHLDYLPSQYLCEFVKSCGFDGVLYRSAVGEGVNLALFHPTKATHGVDLKSFHIDRVKVKFTEK